MQKKTSQNKNTWFADAVECHYNTFQYVMILYEAMQ